MYIEMRDKSMICEWGMEIGELKNDMKYMYVPDELIKLLSDTFIQKLKLLLKNMKYIAIKEFKRFNADKYSNSLEYYNITNLPYDENLLYIRYQHSYKLVREWEEDIEQIRNYSKENQSVDI